MGYLSLIFLEAKFGAPARISEANFGAKPPRPPDMEVFPLGEVLHREMNFGQLVSGFPFNEISIACCQGCPEFPRRELLSLRPLPPTQMSEGHLLPQL